ncbi:MAG: glycine--tRNA ligase subunit beta [Gammaproteobacteria bacterium]|jgi:glycyl-tRNA synthetase beta chain|nr:glycine--tRNA ligase subunit beta [Gammaproteobacteria bacterium]
MNKHEDFLVEIGTEELPPKLLWDMAQAFENAIRSGLTSAQLEYSDSKSYATPRRLAVIIKGLSTEQPEQHIEKKGPAKQGAFDLDGKPSKAMQGFLTSCNTSIDKLTTVSSDKGEWYLYKAVQPGKATVDLLAQIVSEALKKLPAERAMRWADHDHKFIRPIHWLLMIFGNEVIETEMFGHKAGRYTFGHRFHHPEAIKIAQPNEYSETLLKKGWVVADFTERKLKIQQQIEALAQTLQAKAIVPESLLNEVTAIVEWPVAVLCRFEGDFLKVPQEALISSMQSHQKCFALTEVDGKLLPFFITIANIDSKRVDSVKSGNEKVMRARLSDAAFFYQVDLQTRLEDRLAVLEKVSFQAKLGSMLDRSKRLSQLVVFIANQLHANPEMAERAGLLSKADLVSSMVNEFPELQGIMGRYYAQHDGEATEVAAAIFEQYLPRFSGDNLPLTLTGRILSLSDKLDTLVGIFGIGQQPSGSKDPFALRRAAIGLVRLLIEKQLNLDLRELIDEAAKLYANKLPEPQGAKLVMEFCFERLYSYYQEKGIRSDIVQAVLLKAGTNLLDIDRRVQAVKGFRELPEALSLAAANKRVHNILHKNANGVRFPAVNVDLLKEPAERDLYQALQIKCEESQSLLERQAYQELLLSLAELNQPIAAFFDDVMVMCDDEAIRHNRLALLQNLRDLFLQVADISVLQA